MIPMERAPYLPLLAVAALFALGVAQAQTQHRTHHTTGGALTGVVNVNHATSMQLQMLPGIDRTKADAIVQARTSHPFATVDDLGRIKGIDRTWIDRYRAHIAFSGDTTLRRAHPPAKTHAR